MVDGTIHVDDYVKAAANDGQVALAITDLNNLFGGLKFYSACQKKGIKPILGAHVRMEPRPNCSTMSHLVLLVQNSLGYHNLCELLSKGWIEGERDEQATLRWSWLEQYASGLIVLSGADTGIVGQALLGGRVDEARECAKYLSGIFKGCFYLELQRADRPHDESHVRACVALAVQLNLPVVATHPAQFLMPEDHAMHEARVCIAQGLTLADPKRERVFTREQYFKTQDEMADLFADLPAALANTVLIAKRCNLSLALGKPQLPNFPTPVLKDGSFMPMADYFRELCLQGLEDRLNLLFTDSVERQSQRPRYLQRLEFEIATIIKMGFPGYFLIVADFINWAKKNACPVGPGRGSGAGSLVAYSLKITDLDPLYYQLLFERFLNPDRVSMPDFDVDFCKTNRDRVIDYVKDKYGRDAVSQIATFGTMAAKASLRDVGRVMGLGYGQVDAIAKLIVAPPGKTVTLAKVPEVPDEKIIYARQHAPEIARREEADEEVASLLAMAADMESTVRNVGMHAGGVLIAPGKITDFCPLYQQPGSHSAVSQFDKDDVENAGLVKFDFLGLATLTILESAREFIVRRHPSQRDFSYERLPLDDAKVYELFCNGLSEAVFQFESRGMQSLLRDAKPSRLEDLIALNALYRPGPMDLIPTFVARKHGREKIEYPHPLVEKVLQETYGIMVYQEQVMQTAQLLGGYSLGGADLLRRAMGKKKADEMAKHRAIFRDGAAKNDIAATKADEIFDLMEKFAGYGFNKSHAAAYSLLAYHTAYIKVHFAPEFYAANLSVEHDDTDKLNVLMADAKRFDVVIDPPDINLSATRFEPTGSASQRRVRYGLSAIKGAGSHAVDAIVAERNANGPFKSFFDFCARVGRRKLNKRVLEALINAGAFDSLHTNRASVFSSIGRAMQYSESCAANIQQFGLFDDVQEDLELIHVEPWGVAECISRERSSLGFALSAHLFDQYEEEVRQFCPKRLRDYSRPEDVAQVCGVVVGMKVFDGERGRSAVLTIDDKTSTMDISVSADLLQQHQNWLKPDVLVVAQGRLSPDKFSSGVRMQGKSIIGLAQARVQHAKYVSIEIDPRSSSSKTLLIELKKASLLRKPARGHGQNNDYQLPVRLHLKQNTCAVDLSMSERVCCIPDEMLLTRWRGLAKKVNIIY